MSTRQWTSALLLVAAFSASCLADSVFMKKFSQDYVTLGQDLLNTPCQVATIKNFAYKKDVATFVFEDGVIHLLRYVDNRPTTALFVGTGTVHIDIPSHSERHGLWSATHKEAVDDTFQVMFIRMADDFDLELKKRFSFQETSLDWKYFNAAKTAQGEIFFLPRIEHTYDNYFQVMRSLYERKADGYFWADFNRYTFTFDPNRPEEVIVGYEVEGGDVMVREASVFQRRENNCYDDSLLSNITFPTTVVDRNANLTMGGPDGRNIDLAEAHVKLVVNDDSTRFVSMFLHHNLKEESIQVNGAPVDFWRRKDFDFIGIILPSYARKGDTLDCSLRYKGKQFDFAFPRVEDPTPAPITVNYKVPRGFNYVAPGMGAVTQDGRYDLFTAAPQGLFSKFAHEGYAAGYDTVPITSTGGMVVNFLKSEHINKRNFNCYIPDEIYQPTTVGAFDFYDSFLGPPSAIFGFFVYPERNSNAPGLIGIPQAACVAEGSMAAVGGFHTIAGPAVARQWFGPQMRPKTDRDIWIAEAMPLYLGAMYIQNSLSGSEFYSHINNRSDTFFTIADLDRDLPLSFGSRGEPICRVNKAFWVVHMLRFILFDPATSSDRTFLKFVRDLSLLTNIKVFSNNDVIRLAEKHYGQKLDWFFDQWLYGRDYPDYDIKYTVNKSDAGWSIACKAQVKNVDSTFSMPVLIRVEGAAKETQTVRQFISGNSAEFTLGPFPFEPKEFHFNEYYGVLAKASVSKK
jgi:hypothetical protein